MQHTYPEHDVGVLIHGRHLRAVNWDRLLWGDPLEGRLGTGPTAILTMLDLGPERIKLLVIGSGASRRQDGTYEADAIKRLLLTNFEVLEAFNAIQEHPTWRKNRAAIKRLIEDSVTDTVSQNTADEIRNAAGLFSKESVQTVIEITGASHGPRCVVEQAAAREAGIIPRAQRWMLVTDDIPYAGSSARSTLVIEAPHRGDDPALAWPEEALPANIFGYYYTIPNHLRKQYLVRVATVNRRTQEEQDREA